jgi:hypothetical protein
MDLDLDLGGAASREDKAQDYDAQSDDIQADRSDEVVEQTRGDRGVGGEDDMGGSCQGQNRRSELILNSYNQTASCTTRSQTISKQIDLTKWQNRMAATKERVEKMRWVIVLKARTGEVS